jgi:hypothetical protein
VLYACRGIVFALNAKDLVSDDGLFVGVSVLDVLGGYLY